eukprot:255992-Rhodomonas_salina.2
MSPFLELLWLSQQCTRANTVHDDFDVFRKLKICWTNQLQLNTLGPATVPILTILYGAASTVPAATVALVWGSLQLPQADFNVSSVQGSSHRHRDCRWGQADSLT